MSNLPDRIKQYHVAHFDQKTITNPAHLTEEEQELVTWAYNKEWTNPKFKLRHFVGDQQITPFSKLRQWLLEVKSREEQIERMEYEIRKTHLDIKIEERNKNNTDDELLKEKFDVEIMRLTREVGITERRINDYYLERQQLIDLVTELLESEDGKTPDGRSLMEVFNTEEEDEYEAQYWTQRLAKQAAMDMMFYGRINSGNMDAIAMLSSEQQGEVLKLCYSYAMQNQEIQQRISEDVSNKLQIGHKDDTQNLTLAQLSNMVNNEAE
jgi:hypothetical protein